MVSNAIWSMSPAPISKAYTDKKQKFPPKMNVNPKITSQLTWKYANG